MKILLLHGWQSVPGGTKPTYLVRHGHRVTALIEIGSDHRLADAASLKAVLNACLAQPTGAPSARKS
jgi:hypothetical protein